jgi:hypothetical protein
MKYMLMMSATRAELQSFGATMTHDDFKAHVAFMAKLNDDLKASGELVDAQGLSGPEQTKIVRARPGGGPPAVTDGPFPEAKEFLAGFWILDCKTPERVIEIAAYISTAPGHDGVPLCIPVEISPVGEAPPT